MAGKKDKPTLIDLIEKDKFKTPEWVNNTAQQAANNRNSSKKYQNTAPDGMIMSSKPVELQDTSENSHQEYEPRRLKGPRTLMIALASIVLSALLVIGFIIMSGNGENKPDGSDSEVATGDPDAGPAKEITTLEGSEPTGSVIPRHEDKPAPAVTARTGNCFVICAGTKAEVSFIKEFFDNNGLPITIGKLSNNYVATTTATFASQSSQACLSLKAKIEEVGRLYIANRPNGAPNYTLKDNFQGAYAYNVTKNVSKIDFSN
ncbi:MAG: hypothetical protein JEZ07_04445 [Phycisphaerae bacterium]|nr:hypothetical protein [Phycisphaerae bacterium]